MVSGKRCLRGQFNESVRTDQTCEVAGRVDGVGGGLDAGGDIRKKTQRVPLIYDGFSREELSAAVGREVPHELTVA